MQPIQQQRQGSTIHMLPIPDHTARCQDPMIFFFLTNKLGIKGMVKVFFSNTITTFLFLFG